MKDKIMFGLMMVLVVVSLFGVVSAEMLVSDAGVEYDSRILEEFAKLEGTDGTFVQIIIQLKDFSDAENLLSIFNESEIKDIAIRNLTKKMGVGLTKEGFDKLISDSRVEAVYYDAPMYFLDGESSAKEIFIILSILIIVILIVLILYFIIKKRKK